jgi:hypothetical protein
VSTSTCPSVATHRYSDQNTVSASSSGTPSPALDVVDGEHAGAGKAKNHARDRKRHQKRRRIGRDTPPAPEYISLLSSSDAEEDNRPSKPAWQQPTQPGISHSRAGMPSENPSETTSSSQPLWVAQGLAGARRLARLATGDIRALEKASEDRISVDLISDEHRSTAPSSLVVSLGDVPLESIPSSPPTPQTPQTGRRGHRDRRAVTPEIRTPIIRETNLCPEQAELVDIILSGRNVFYTGSAGCGKSTVLKAFTRRLRDKGRQVDIVAPTGISALGVGGSTIFIYAGWNLASMKKSLDELRSDAHAKFTRKRLKSTDVLVIDEISSK